MIRDRRRIGTNRMFGDVFPQNVSAVTALKDALDNGQMVHARVLSGVGKGLGCAKAFDVKKVGAIGPPSEEHSILIFAHDGDEFAFHDPDATASNNPQVGFGRLFFADGTVHRDRRGRSSGDQVRRPRGRRAPLPGDPARAGVTASSVVRRVSSCSRVGGRGHSARRPTRR
jgi:hypothetical protein